MAIDGCLLRHSDVVLNMVSVLGHGTKGCTWVLMLPWHRQLLAHLFTNKVSVCVCTYLHMQKTKDV